MKVKVGVTSDLPLDFLGGIYIYTPSNTHKQIFAYTDDIGVIIIWPHVVVIKHMYK